MLTTRKLVNQQLNDIEAKQFKPGAPISQSQNTLMKMPHIKEEFRNLSLEIVAKKSDTKEDLSTDLKDVMEFNSRWYNVWSTIQELITANTSDSTYDSQLKVRLPVINLHEFCGCYKE